MKDLGLPLGFMNRSPLEVDDEGKVRLGHTGSISNFDDSSSSSVNDHFNSRSKKSHKKRGRKVRGVG